MTIPLYKDPDGGPSLNEILSMQGGMNLDSMIVKIWESRYEHPDDEHELKIAWLDLMGEDRVEKVLRKVGLRIEPHILSAYRIMK